MAKYHSRKAGMENRLVRNGTYNYYTLLAMSQVNRYAFEPTLNTIEKSLFRLLIHMWDRRHLNRRISLRLLIHMRDRRHLNRRTSFSSAYTYVG